MTQTNEITRLRWIRVAAILTALWGIPLMYMLTHGTFSVLGLFAPSVRKALLLVALGFQLFRIAKPIGGDSPRVVVFTDSNVVHELSLVAMSLLLGSWVTFAHLPGIPISLAPAFHYGVDVLNVLLLVAWRPTTVVDGDRQVVQRFSFIPKSLPFGLVRGLGTIQTRYLRNGRHTGTGYSVGVFPTSGASPWPVVGATSEIDVGTKIQLIHAATGIPIATR